MKCPYCRNELNGDEVFCFFCGRQLRAADKHENEEEEKKPKQERENTVTDDSKKRSETGSGTNDRKTDDKGEDDKKSPIKLIIIISLIALAAIITSAVLFGFLIGSKPSQTTANQNSSTTADPKNNNGANTQQGAADLTPTQAPTPVPAPTQAPTPAPTPAPTQPPREKTYSVVVAKVTWEQARNAAASSGGHLVTINNAEEFEKVKSLLSASAYSKVKNVWIGACAPPGLNSAAAAAAYWNSSSAQWITGEPFTFAQWRAGEPSGYDSNINAPERYLQIFRPKADNYIWSFNDSGDDLSEYKDGTLAYIIEYER